MPQGNVCVWKGWVLKGFGLKKIKKIKFGEKMNVRALQIFKIWYTRNKLSANVFSKQKP